MGSDKLRQFEAEALAKAQAMGRYKAGRSRKAPWKPVPAPWPTLKSVKWATSDISLAAFLTARRAKPVVAVDLHSDRPILGFDQVPEKLLTLWEKGPKGHVNTKTYAAARDILLERMAAGKKALLETVLLKL